MQGYIGQFVFIVTVAHIVPQFFKLINKLCHLLWISQQLRIIIDQLFRIQIADRLNFTAHHNGTGKANTYFLENSMHHNSPLGKISRALISLFTALQ